MAREEVARNQRSRLYGGMIEAVARRLRAHDRRPRDRAGRRLAARLLRTVRQQGRVLPGDLRRRRRAGAQAAARRVAVRARLGQPPARLLPEPARRHRRGRRRGRAWCSSTRSASARARANGCSSPALAFERIVATAFSLAPEQVCYPPLTSRAIVSGVRHIVFNRLREGRDRELADAHRRSARLDRGLPHAARHAPAHAHARAPAAPAARAGGLPRRATTGARGCSARSSTSRSTRATRR